MGRNKLSKQIGALALSIVMLSGIFSATTTYAAKTITELKKEQAAVEEKEKAARERLEQIKTEKKTLTNEIEALDIEITIASDQLNLIHEQLDAKQAELDKTTLELEEAERQKDEHYTALKSRLKYIQENGKIGYFQVLFKAKGFGDFLNRVEYVNDIVTYDQNMYQSLQEIEDTIAEKKLLIETQLSDIEILLRQQEEKMLELEAKKDAKEDVMKKIEASEEKTDQQVKELISESSDIEKEIKRLQAEAAAAAAKAAAEAAAAARKSGGGGGGSGYAMGGTGEAPNGQFGWPVTGYYTLSSGYVNRVNPITGRGEFHTGIDIPAPAGTPILAAEAGTVIGSGVRGGYGNTIVIDHGNGVSTLYAHNSSLVVSVGDVVARGQTVAKCGSTGMSTGNHCHFEVRINGSPVNPNGYVR